MVVVDVVLTTPILDGIVELLYIAWDTVGHMDCTSSSKRDEESKSRNRGELRELHGDIDREHNPWNDTCMNYEVHQWLGCHPSHQCEHWKHM
jgi:hypothetical protein